MTSIAAATDSTAALAIQAAGLGADETSALTAALNAHNARMADLRAQMTAQRTAKVSPR